MKKGLLYSLLFAIPVLLMGSVVVGHAYWKNSIKNDSAKVVQNYYSVILEDNTNSENNATYTKLEYDSSFELPTIDDEGFVGWLYSGNTYEPGYYIYSEIASISTTSITFVAQYN